MSDFERKEQHPDDQVASSGKSRGVAAHLAKDLIGRKDGDGKVVTAAKVLLPIGAVQGAAGNVSGSVGRIKAMVEQMGRRKDGASFDRLVINPEIDDAVVVHNANRLRLFSRLILLVGLFIGVDVIAFILFGFWKALFSAPAVLLCYVIAGRYAFFARALVEKKFSHPTLLDFLKDGQRPWVLDVLLNLNPPVLKKLR